MQIWPVYWIMQKKMSRIFEYIGLFWSKTAKRYWGIIWAFWNLHLWPCFIVKHVSSRFCCKLNLNAWLSLFLAYSHKSILGRYYKVFGCNTCEHIYYFIWNIWRFGDMLEKNVIFTLRGVFWCDFVEIMGLEFLKALKKLHRA